MSAILLAATKADGHDVNRRSSLPSLVTYIVTPRTRDQARGVSVRHIFETPAFHALAPEVRAEVLAAALPAIATSDCPVCRRKSGDSRP